MSLIAELARAAGATITAGDRHWTIGNGLIDARLAWSDAAGVTIERLGAWNGAPDAPTIRLTWNGASLSGLRPALGDATASSDDDSVTLSITARYGDVLQVTQYLQCWGEVGIIEQWLEIEALQSGLLRDVVPARLSLAISHPVLHTISGVQKQGGWKPDSGPYRSFRREEQLLNGDVTLRSGIRSTWDEMPWAAISGGADAAGVFAGLRYSGQWRTDVTGSPTGGVSLGIGPDQIETALQPGDTWTSPRAFIGVYAGDLDDAGAVMHDYQRQILSSPLPDDGPWVQYNTWFSYLTDYNAEVLAKEIDISADLGMDLFYIDAGWWVGNPRNDWHFSSGLGNWRENPDKFPDGIKASADYVRAKGMKFGIWVEPERVDLRTVTSGTWRPEWLLRREGAYEGPDWPQDTETAWLCFGHPEAQAWAIEWVGRLVEELGIAWLKWDSNWWGVCTAADHGHGAGDGELAQVAGVHRVMDALRARFPDLIIENCAGGGTRMDFEMAAHTHTTWVSDASDPADRVRFHSEGAGYLFVPATLNAWVTESTIENLRRRDLPESALKAIVRSRMLGAFGVSCRMVEWGEDTRRIVRDCITEYKTFRHLLKDGYMAHLLPQPTLECPRFPSPSVWEAVMFHDWGHTEAVMLAFRNRAPNERLSLTLDRFDPHATYRVSGDGIESGTHSGASLAAEGISLACPILGSALIRIEKVADR